MRHIHLFLSLLFPLCAFSQSDLSLDIQMPPRQNTIVSSYSNEPRSNLNGVLERSMDYPTQIIRISHNLKNQQLDCNQVNEIIDKTIIQNITPDKFIYNIYSACQYEPETHLAIELTLHSYFDPVDDKAIEFLKSYLKEYNDSDFLGTKLKIESAKGLVISLNIIAGIKKNPHASSFLEYRKDRTNFYFKNNYEMNNQLITDIYNRFFSNDPSIIFPFLNKWFYAHADNIYKGVLKDSNYVELQPERIFLMEGNELFVSDLKLYFAHNCSTYENKHCLNQE